MAAGNVTTTTAAGFIPELWSLEVIDAYSNNGVLKDLVDTSFQELARAGHGDIIQVPNVEALTVTDVNQDTGPVKITQASGGSIGGAGGKTDSTTTITVQTWKGGKITYPDIVAVQSLSSLRKAQTEQLGIAMALDIDTALATLVASITQNVGTLAVDLTDDNILRGRQYLDDANSPNNDRVLVISPAQLMGFFKIDRYANSLYRGTTGNLDGAKGRGYIGPLYGLDVYESSNMVSNTSGHDNVMFQRKWAALVVQKGPVIEQWRNTGILMDEIIIHAVYGVKQMRATSGIWMKGL